MRDVNERERLHRLDFDEQLSGHDKVGAILLIEDTALVCDGQNTLALEGQVTKYQFFA
ncbi:MAG TPA: hypothetical protein VHB79_19980 [Polyangiaceae bacterium]|nr:hypothetical protein [Polyangiaceae bacterium]